MGLYASILPLIAYALFGSSRTLSVGPVAVASLMTASAVGAIASQGVVDYASAATLLALLGGLMLIAMGLLKFGFVSHFLSHPVVSGLLLPPPSSSRWGSWAPCSVSRSWGPPYPRLAMTSLHS